MLRWVALVRTDVLEERSASIIRVTWIGELGTLAVTSKQHMLWRNTITSKIHQLLMVKPWRRSSWMCGIFLCSTHRLLGMANVVPSSPILVTLMMEALSSFETSVLTRTTWRNTPEDGILQNWTNPYWYILTSQPRRLDNNQSSSMVHKFHMPIQWNFLVWLSCQVTVERAYSTSISGKCTGCWNAFLSCKSTINSYASYTSSFKYGM
jgi:hypothetical protein